MPGPCSPTTTPMRLNLTLSPSTEPVPFNHLHRLTGALHKWLGSDNEWHDGISLYSFGWLHRGQARNGALAFPNGSRWRLSFHEEDAMKAVLRGILNDPTVMCGMRVTEAQPQETPPFDEQKWFRTDKAPVVTRRRREDGSRAYLTFDDPSADETLTRTFRTRLRQAGLDGEHLQSKVRFDREYDGARTKVTRIKNIDHKGSICPVIVEGTPEAVRFAWNVGVGELTGSGFGALQ